MLCSKCFDVELKAIEIKFGIWLDNHLGANGMIREEKVFPRNCPLIEITQIIANN